MSKSGFRISELSALVVTLGGDSIGSEDGARMVIHQDGTGHIEGKTYQTIANGQRRAKHFTLNLTRADTDALRAAYTQVISRGDDYHGCQRCGRNPVVVHGRRYCSNICANTAGEYSVGKTHQCGSCENVFFRPTAEHECPECGSGNWVVGMIDDSDEYSPAPMPTSEDSDAQQGGA